MLIRHPGPRRYKEEITVYHAEGARYGSPHDRAFMLLGLGEPGAATSGWITDFELAIHVCDAHRDDLTTARTVLDTLIEANQRFLHAQDPDRPTR
ncbi:MULTISPECIES: hypothetical protein [Catenuloplanes]|uniref:Uncharacterized protein n=1 Tax=Catenuloplanes niger TaxID=587534 RepID=A0AAE4CVY5_9ACTN|nr:hypothetical protein [Catenuloplanes niger]MDR7325932.1 hypothetical protein [Catenuloplanes niger]